jgi:threonine dehydrogenase-like Zn-dependent dehydrogenase
MPLGHEAVGVVTEVGSGAQGLSVGMRVAVNPMGEITNVIGNGGTEGAFADYLLVRNAEAGRNLIPLPDSLPTHIAAIAEPLGVGLHAVNRSQIQPSETAVVFGVGPIGLGAVIWLKQKGARRIVAVDLSEQRLAIASHYGADLVVVPGRDDLSAVLEKEHGSESVLGAPCVSTDVFIDAAGAPGIVPQVIELAKLHARLVILAVYREPVAVEFGRMLSKELTITTSIGYPDEFGNVVAMLAERPEFFEHYISHRFGFQQFHEAFDVAGTRSAGKVMVEFDN